VPGLEVEVARLAKAEGLDVQLGTRLAWLTGRGHTGDSVTDAPRALIDCLAAIHAALEGDATSLAAKRAGAPPIPDLIHVPTGCIIEVDERQHFTTARERSFEHYPSTVALGFDVDEYRQLIATWRSRADRAFAHRTAVDFPSPGGRQAQRAYNDSVRDLLAPTFTGRPVLRLPVPDRRMDGVIDRLKDACVGSADRRRTAPRPGRRAMDPHGA
jgi:hypothetical protein